MLVRRIAEADGKGKVTIVDIDPETFPDVRAKLGELAVVARARTALIYRNSP